MPGLNTKDYNLHGCLVPDALVFECLDSVCDIGARMNFTPLLSFSRRPHPLSDPVSLRVQGPK